MRRLLLSCVVPLWLLASSPALGCLYTHSPEPVGAPAAAFIAGRMVDEAAFVDLAVPERAAPMRTPDGRPLAGKQVAFRVVERLKGASPARFVLFAWGLKPTGTTPVRDPMLHWVDEAGGIIPHATRWEAPATEQFGSTSCDPGFIEPIAGRTYLVFRAADGGLLGPVAFAPGARPGRGFPFVDATGTENAVWLRAVRARAAGLRGRTPARAAALPAPYEADPSRASVAFRRPLTQAEARRLLGAAGARPYAVYTEVAGRPGEHRLPEAQASLDAFAVARREVAMTLGGPPGISRGVSDRARALLREYTPERLAADPEKLRYARALVGSVAEQAARAAEARGDGPFVTGVEFLGGMEAQRRLRASPLVREVRSGFRVRGRPAAPQPLYERSAPPDFGKAAEIAGLTPAELHARLRALAEAPLQPPASPPRPPSDELGRVAPSPAPAPRPRPRDPNAEAEMRRRAAIEPLVGELNGSLHDRPVRGFSDLWIQNEPTYAVVVAVKRPADEEAIVARADPALRPFIVFRDARLDSAEIRRARPRVLAALQGAPGGWSSGYDPKIGKFRVDAESQAVVAYFRGRLPPDLRDDVDLRVTGTVIMTN